MKYKIHPMYWSIALICLVLIWFGFKINICIGEFYFEFSILPLSRFF